MFYYLNGVVSAMEANLAVIDCGGVGFACNTTAYTLSQLQIGKPYKLYTHCNVKEDAFDIYGFGSKDELASFQQLLAVSGVGPKAALSILSSLTPDQFALAIVSGDEKTLTRAPGVGKKMAQRILLELKDKIAGDFQTSDQSSGPIPAHGAGKMSEATAALASLGYTQSEIGAALKGIEVENLPVEEVIRRALRAMVKQ